MTAVEFVHRSGTEISQNNTHTKKKKFVCLEQKNVWFQFMTSASLVSQIIGWIWIWNKFQIIRWLMEHKHRTQYVSWESYQSKKDVMLCWYLVIWTVKQKYMCTYLNTYTKLPHVVAVQYILNVISNLFYSLTFRISGLFAILRSLHAFPRPMPYKEGR